MSRRIEHTITVPGMDARGVWQCVEVTLQNAGYRSARTGPTTAQFAGVKRGLLGRRTETCAVVVSEQPNGTKVVLCGRIAPSLLALLAEGVRSRVVEPTNVAGSPLSSGGPSGRWRGR